ncbi:hypothetical protein BABINDRAFT_164914 [Babjeviella inositovora NRRL Y-12698]|uniref:Decapping nuclease n=1 Tax=Babjeviella inositovora NRRL Y-12698 TaxID=984486 RepID=A0A1E3QZY4_9ASCO|nr:uncharacterized protein BABINDRAFT_164914 [Babjeviella inositovora NRRL Y-12698]ODQ83216.1 hypothetical protein BABINDRAFT_164914 [Babjeviella inositovora NRRL Y-12698]
MYGANILDPFNLKHPAKPNDNFTWIKFKGILNILLDEKRSNSQARSSELLEEYSWLRQNMKKDDWESDKRMEFFIFTLKSSHQTSTHLELTRDATTPRLPGRNKAISAYTSGDLKGTEYLTAFSVDDHGYYYFNEDKEKFLSYYHRPSSLRGTKGISLKPGYEKWRKTLITHRPKYNHVALLHAIKEHEEKLGVKVKADIIVTRRVLKSFLQSLKSFSNSFELDIVFFDEHLFIKETAASKARNQEVARLNTRGLKYIYAGYKYESRVTLPKPASEYENARIIQETQEHNPIAHGGEGFIAVVQRKVKNINLIISGEIDCIQSPASTKAELKTSDFMELKVTGDTKYNFSDKLFRAWSQSMVIGTSTIVYGFRSQDLMLKRMQLYKVSEMPDSVLQAEQCEESTQFFVSILEWIVATIPKDEGKAWRLEYTRNQQYELKEYVGSKVETIRDDVVRKEFQRWRKEKISVPWQDYSHNKDDDLAVSMGGLHLS